jgi:hypothetical protein
VRGGAGARATCCRLRPGRGRLQIRHRPPVQRSRHALDPSTAPPPSPPSAASWRAARKTRSGPQVATRQEPPDQPSPLNDLHHHKFDAHPAAGALPAARTGPPGLNGAGCLPAQSLPEGQRDQPEHGRQDAEGGWNPDHRVAVGQRSRDRANRSRQSNRTPNRSGWQQCRSPRAATGISARSGQPAS